MRCWSIYRADVHNSGSFSTNEQAMGNPFQGGSIETCCTVAWLALSVETLRLTGDSRIADALEHATWNAVLAYEHPSGRWCTYDTPMNGKRLASAHSIVFQSRPGTPELNCCSVNGTPIERVTPGSYLKIERAWNPGDKLTIDLDLRLRALRGDEHVQFNTSLLRGPILLAFVQKHNTLDPAGMPELDLAALQLEPLAADDVVVKDKPLGPIVAFATQAADGKRVVLCDFGSAGAYGTYSQVQ